MTDDDARHPSASAEPESGVNATSLRDAFLPAILHGDETHRAWLREAVDCFIDGRPVPLPTGKGSRDAGADAMRSENERLRALLPYVDHKPGCRMRVAMGQSCVCGLRKARAALSETRP